MKKLIFVSLILFLCFALTSTSYAVSPVTDGLVLQLEADAITGLTDGDTISVWPASAGNDAIAAGPTDVVFKSNIINGKPVVRFDGNGGFVTFDPIEDILTVFWVIKEDADVNNVDQGQWRHLLNRDGSADFHRGTVAQSAGDAYCAIISNEWGGGVGSGEGSDRVRNGVVAINADVVDPLTTSVPLELSIISIEASDVLRANNFSYDDAQGVQRSWDGDLAEVLIYNRALTPAEVRNIGGYLTEKYGLTTSYPAYEAATLVSPADGEIDVEVDVTLEWTSTSGAATSDVYLGTDPNSALALIGSTAGSSLSTTVSANETYYWQVVEQVNAADPNTLFISPVSRFKTLGAIPSFDAPYGEQPEGATVFEGETVILTATAGVTEGQDDNISYQWLKDGAGITGETGTSLTIEDIAADDDGLYSCQATNSEGTGESNSVRVKVIQLIGHWPLDDGTFADVVGGNDGTGVGSPAIEAGIVGQAVKFNGLGDQAITLPTDAMGSDTNFTLMFWNWTVVEAGTGYMVASGSPNGFELLYMWQRDGGTLYGNLWVGNGAGNLGTVPGDYPRGEWHHNAMTHDAASRTWAWYVDGSFKAERTFDADFPGLDDVIFLGNRRNMQRPFEGLLDDFRLYNAPLPPAAIARVYTDATGNSVCLEAIANDLNGDCKVDLVDFALMAQEWMECNLVPASACD